jgi:very-short-patch-repair endonuclease
VKPKRPLTVSGFARSTSPPARGRGNANREVTDLPKGTGALTASDSSPPHRGRGGSGEARDGEGVTPPQPRTRRKPGTTKRARSLRQGGNIAEARLWDELKDRRLGGYKFVRQLPIGRYFADFACRKARLVVEVDGSQHADQESDRDRDRFMSELGWSVIRFWNVDVLKELTPVCETILAALDGGLSGPVDAYDLSFVPASGCGAPREIGAFSPPGRGRGGPAKPGR